MNLNFLGGAMEVGGSCIYIKAGGYGILLDSGIRQGSNKDPLPDFRRIQECGGIDVIIISHAHLDHIGTLPMISKAYPQARIYMTHMTQDLTRVLLYDSLKIMGRREDEIPHYSEVDVKSMLERIYPIRYQTPTEILANLSVTLYPAGHIAGAACVYLVSEEGSIFYSGDFATFAQRTIEGARIPKLRPDIAIIESTYGNRLHANRQVEEERLVDVVKECVQKEMKILIPAFALGRAQEVLLILRSAMQKGELPKVPIHVDGMVRDINTMYTRNPVYLRNALAKRIFKGDEPFYTEEIQAVPPNINREELLEKKGAQVFVASSGMLTGGPSMMYAKKIASMENGCIIITGYQDEEAPGRALLNLMEEKEERKITLDGTSIPVNCQVVQVGLSAHGDKTEIAALMDKITPRRIFLVHGDTEAISEAGQELSSDYKRQIYMPKCGESYEIEIKAKRKQLSNTLAYSMQKKELLTLDNEKLLWEYVKEHYPKKVFTLSEIAFVWYGTKKTEEETLQQLQEHLMKSNYFSPEMRRLFLFVANTEEQVQENLAPKKITNQVLEEQVRTIVKDIPYKKIGYFEEKQLVTLTFDYPDAQDKKQFEEYAMQYEQQTGWKLEISPSVNHQAMGTLLRTLFGQRIVKLSYYQDKKQYAITLKDTQSEDADLAGQFANTTGWGLDIKGSGIGIQTQSQSGQTELIAKKKHVFQPESNTEQVEQNLAFSCIDASFAEEHSAPYKKSIKSDHNGKYMELSFLSPKVGEKASDTIQKIADQIGWRMKIADSVNQNEIMNILLALCDTYEVQLKKNPSYLPNERAFRLKLVEEELELPEAFCEEFRELTGCEVTK